MARKKAALPLSRARPSSRLFKLLQFQLHLVSRYSLRQAEAEVQQSLGLRLLEARIIGMVGSFGAMPVRILLTHGLFEKGHASRLVKALVRKGLIRSDPDPEDQRAAILRLTPEGRSLNRDLYKIASRRNERWLSALTERQREALRQALATLMQLSGGPGPDDAGRILHSIAPRRRGATRRG